VSGLLVTASAPHTEIGLENGTLCSRRASRPVRSRPPGRWRSLDEPAMDPTDAPLTDLLQAAARGEAGTLDQLLGSSERTVRRQWERARAYLLVSLQE